MRSLRILVTVSAITSVLVALLVFSYVKNTENRLLAELQPQKALVALSDIEPGTTPDQLPELTEEVVLPLRSFPKGAIAAASDLKSTDVVLGRILAGTILLRNQFGPSTRLVGGLVVPVGKVVLTLDLEEQQRLGQFVRPGAQVAVYSTTDKGVTVMIVPDASVLAIGAETGGAAMTYDSSMVTLALDPEGAKRLLSAARTSAIHLALLGEGVATSSSGTGR